MIVNVDGIVVILVWMYMQGVVVDVKWYFVEGLQYWLWVLLGYFNIGIMIVLLIGWWVLLCLLEWMCGIFDVYKFDLLLGDDVDVLIGLVLVWLDKVCFCYFCVG